MGERLRDYALVASAVHSPIIPLEPWMAETPLNYYFYWYRFGHVLHALFGLQTWEVYHSLVALSLSFFLTFCFLILRDIAKFSPLFALASSTLIALGSNIEGVLFFLKADKNWWGPSRVIPGTINEFPAWSFLLGDAHPHYLNLSVTPLCIVALHTLLKQTTENAWRFFIGISVFVIPPLWLYNANAWEVPVWLILCGIGVLFFLLPRLTTRLGYVWSLRPSLKDFADLKLASASLLILFLGISLFASSRNILPGDMPLRPVTSSIGHSSVQDLLRHWGFPLFLILSATILSSRTWGWMTLCLIFIIPSLAANKALYLLLVAFALNIWRLRQQTKSALSIDAIVLETLGVLGLFLIIFPELFFFDDSYGGDVERMNTVFKAYTAAWLPLHVFALWRTSTWLMPWLGEIKDIPRIPILVTLIALMTGFFTSTIQVRKSSAHDVIPLAQGLSEIDKRFPGAATTIQILERSRFGTVLEAQGPAYDFTTHVATLSGKPAYLGWTNHVNLLSKDYAEVNRRTEVTNQIYTDPNCENIRTLARRERITYIVLGPLEKKAYPSLQSNQFSCLKEIVRSKEYKVYVP
jgi:uncharacterized membrane protein